MAEKRMASASQKCGCVKVHPKRYLSGNSAKLALGFNAPNSALKRGWWKNPQKLCDWLFFSHGNDGGKIQTSGAPTSTWYIVLYTCYILSVILDLVHWKCQPFGKVWKNTVSQNDHPVFLEASLTTIRRVFSVKSHVRSSAAQRSTIQMRQRANFLQMPWISSA